MNKDHEDLEQWMERPDQPGQLHAGRIHNLFHGPAGPAPDPDHTWSTFKRSLLRRAYLNPIFQKFVFLPS